MGDPTPTTTTNEPPPIDLENPPFPLTEIDRALLATPDSEIHRITWPDLQRIISTNKLEELKRLPSDLKRYLAWSHDIKSRYGSITQYVLKERLGWDVLPVLPVLPKAQGENATAGPPKFAYKSEEPFRDERDFAVLMNDWPYGFASGIVHLLVWSKTPIAVDAERGDVTDESRRVIIDFVQRYFVDDLQAQMNIEEKGGDSGGEGEGQREKGNAGEKVLWFKNWVSLQSVHGVDHVHVLVRDVPQEVVEGWCRRRDL